MTAFLFINPSIADPKAARRVDLGNIATLFGDRDELVPPPRLKSPMARFAVIGLIAIGAIGDMLLVAHPGLVASCTAAPSRDALGKSVSF